MGIKHASTNPIQVRREEYRTYAYILRKLKCRHSRRGKDKDRDQGHPEARASLKQVEIEMEKTSITRGTNHLEKFKARAPDGHHRCILLSS